MTFAVPFGAVYKPKTDVIECPECEHELGRPGRGTTACFCIRCGWNDPVIKLLKKNKRQGKSDGI